MEIDKESKKIVLGGGDSGEGDIESLKDTDPPTHRDEKKSLIKEEALGPQE